MIARFPLRCIVSLLFASALLTGCGTSEYNRRYAERLKGLGDMLHPEANRTPFTAGSIRLPRFIDANVKPLLGLPEELRLPFPAAFQFGYQKTLAGAKPEEVLVAFIESAALKGELIDAGLPPVMQANAKENSGAVTKIDVRTTDGKTLAMRYYTGTLNLLSIPDNPNSTKVPKRVDFYFYENGGKTLAGVWIASPAADADVRFFEAAKQAMATLVYDPNAAAKPAPAGPVPGAAGAAQPAKKL